MHRPPIRQAAGGPSQPAQPRPHKRYQPRHLFHSSHCVPSPRLLYTINPDEPKPTLVKPTNPCRRSESSPFFLLPPQSFLFSLPSLLRVVRYPHCRSSPRRSSQGPYPPPPPRRVSTCLLSKPRAGSVLYLYRICLRETLRSPGRTPACRRRCSLGAR